MPCTKNTRNEQLGKRRHFRKKLLRSARVRVPDLQIVEEPVFAHAAEFDLGLRRVGDAGGGKGGKRGRCAFVDINVRICTPTPFPLTKSKKPSRTPTAASSPTWPPPPKRRPSSTASRQGSSIPRRRCLQGRRRPRRKTHRRHQGRQLRRPRHRLPRPGRLRIRRPGQHQQGSPGLREVLGR